LGRKRKKRRNRSGPYRRPDREGWWARIAGRWWHSDAEDEETAAAEWRAAVEAARPRPMAFVAEPPTVGDALAAFLADVDLNRHAQFKWYDCKLNDFSASIHTGLPGLPMADLPLADLRPIHVLAWLAGKRGSSTNRYNCGRAVRGAVAWYCLQAGLGESPLKGIKLPRPAKRRYIFPPWVPLLALSIALRRPKLNPNLPEFLALVIFTGARPSELCRARGRDVDADGSMIRLPTGKQGARTIPIPRGMWPMLVRLKAAAGAAGWLVPNAAGNQQTKSGWTQAWRRLRERLDLPAEATIYQWRHTWATHAVAAGIPLGIVAQAMGTSLKMVSEVYAHLDRGAMEKWKGRI